MEESSEHRLQGLTNQRIRSTRDSEKAPHSVSPQLRFTARGRYGITPPYATVRHV